MVDRLTFHAHLINTGSQSYRLRATRAAKARTPAGNDNTGQNIGKDSGQT